ncbi:hypothetical protein [Palleronia aestuarii]|uniref:hypothetical protein n=1 Tax=Palleronia aestuarii TaxID=568105 RepID=UPI0011B3E582|nr:hypothetical protein [Palleronia aestuarii]
MREAIERPLRGIISPMQSADTPELLMRSPHSSIEPDPYCATAETAYVGINGGKTMSRDRKGDKDSNVGVQQKSARQCSI